MYVNLSKKFITKNLLIHLSQSHLGRPPKIPLWRIVKAIIYRLKSGCQWRELPMSTFCGPVLIPWNTVYYHFRKWCIPLAISEPIDGNHNDLFEIEIFFTKMIEDMENAQISANGLLSVQNVELLTRSGSVVPILSSSEQFVKKVSIPI